MPGLKINLSVASRTQLAESGHFLGRRSTRLRSPRSGNSWLYDQGKKRGKRKERGFENGSLGVLVGFTREKSQPGSSVVGEDGLVPRLHNGGMKTESDLSYKHLVRRERSREMGKLPREIIEGASGEKIVVEVLPLNLVSIRCPEEGGKLAKYGHKVCVGDPKRRTIHKSTQNRGLKTPKKQLQAASLSKDLRNYALVAQ